MSRMLIRNATLMDGQAVDIRIHGDTIAALAPGLREYGGETTIDARGGVVLPGLHDHHMHLLALAASFGSFDCAVSETAHHLADRLKQAAGSTPDIRAVNYHERIAGDIDRDWLDLAVPDVPVRVQHRSGRLWILNSAALARIARKHSLSSAVQATGRLYDHDMLVRGDAANIPDLAPVGQALAARGVTAVTDATPANGLGFIDIIRQAQKDGALPQRVGVMGTAEILTAPQTDSIIPLAHKLHLHEGDYPPPDAFIAMAHAARAAGGALAVHCVTASDLIYTLALLEEAGCTAGARIEHASVVPADLIPRLAVCGLTVVTQPNFVAERGDDYRLDIPAQEHETLYRCATLKSACVKLGGGTDAPFGHWDPWAAMHAATQRRTKCGAVLGPAEMLSPEDALALFTTTLADPGGAPRSVAPGQPADLCILEAPWAIARQRLGAVAVTATLRDGVVIYRKTKIGGRRAA